MTGNQFPRWTLARQWLGSGVLDETPTNTAFGGAVIQGVERGRIRRLQGFLKKAHREPDAASPATEAFVRKVGTPEVSARAEALFRQLRVAFGWKRRDLECHADGGQAQIRTPDFSLQLEIAQDPEDPRCYVHKLEIGQFTRPAVVEEAAFLAVFRLLCDTVVIEFPSGVDVASRIDAAEDSDELRPLLDYPSDASWMSLKPSGPMPVEMRLEAHSASFRIPRGGDLLALIEGTQRLLATFSAAGVGLSLDQQS